MAQFYWNHRGFQLFIVSLCLIFSYRVAAALETVVDPQAIQEGTTPNPAKFADWSDWEIWKPNSDVVNAFPYYRMGYDFDGLVGWLALELNS